MSYVLAWTSGHVPPKKLFYHETGDGWGCTDDINEATIFEFEKEALDCWREKHCEPDVFEKYIQNGSVRAEQIGRAELNL